jgi:sugar phosphate isomerase/epimerase
LDELHSAGYEGTELGPYGYLPPDPDVLRQELQARSLALASAFVPLRLKELGLDAIGYEGWAVVEQDVDTSGRSPRTPFESARASRDYLRTLSI